MRRALEESESRRQKQQAEALLRQTSERLQHLVETSKVIPWELDLETWQLTYVGPHAVSLLGYPLEEWFQKGFWDAHIHLEDPDALYHLCGGSEGDHDFYCHMTARNGVTVHLHCVAKIHCVDKTTSSDGPRALPGFMMDVTS